MTVPVMRSAHAHGRTMLLAIATLAVLATSPLLGHHLPTGLRELLAGRDHLWGLCMLALHQLADPLHDVYHLLLAFGLALATSTACARGAPRTVRSRAFDAVRPAAGGHVWRAGRSARLDPARLRLVRGQPAPAFTAGLLRPSVFPGT